MNREILFRGKRDKNGEWAFGDLLQIDRKAFISVTKEGWLNSPEMFLVDPTTVGQYTWLTDKSGVKIFEGDIAEHSHLGTGQVMFKNGSWKLKFKGRKTSGFGSFSKEVLVVGNIHDNPELLK